MSDTEITVALDSLPRTFPSIFVPVVPSTVSDVSIYRVVKQYELGYVREIRRLPHKDKEQVSKLVLDIAWSDKATDIRRKLILGETLRLKFCVRDGEEKFWVVRMYR